MPFPSGYLLLFLLTTSIATATDYFPQGSLGSSAEIHKFKAGWYTSYLQALGEKPMFGFDIPKNIERYRFIWLRTFHRPVVMRVEVKEGSGTLIVKVSDGTGGFERGKLVREETRALSPRDLEIIRAHFRVQDFFALPSFDEKNAGADGSEWIIEAQVRGRYHVVTRWTPEDGAVRRIGMNLLEIVIGGDFTPIY